jgi:hypothetical protein
MGEKRKCTGVWWESPKERDHSEGPGVDGRMGSEWILGRLAGGVEWIQLAQDRDRWRALVNTVMYVGILAPRSQLEENDTYSLILLFLHNDHHKDGLFTVNFATRFVVHCYYSNTVEK